MVTRYLYLDDENPNSLLPYTNIVTGGSKALSIDIEHPADYSDNYSALFTKLKQYQGLILDWRLDDTVNSQKKRFALRAAALAQQIRTKETERKASAVPIVIWSQQRRLNKSYYGDVTSHDLFDLVCNKEDLVTNAEFVRVQLVALASGYKSIAKVIKPRQAVDLVGLLKAKENYVDVRMREYFRSKIRAIHDIARVLKKDLLDRPGPLVDEDLLAARLGVDRKASNSWKKLINLLSKYSYSGPFYEAWPRWWAIGVEKEWWPSIGKESDQMSLLTGDERVKVIKEETGLRSLVAATPLMKGYHGRFYTVCQHYRMPLDPVDGVIIDESEPQPWQDRRYLSLDAALRSLNDDFRPHPVELERLRALRKDAR